MNHLRKYVATECAKCSGQGYHEFYNQEEDEIEREVCTRCNGMGNIGYFQDRYFNAITKAYQACNGKIKRGMLK